jgi:signal recognition particle subunit SRP72
MPQAYCLYRKNALQEAISALEGLERNDDILQLEAQIYYRLGDFNACIESYNRLSNLDSSELKTNLIASYISGGRSNEVSMLMQKLKVTPRSGFELAYNAACASIENNDFAKAEELLLLARRYFHVLFVSLEKFSV